MKTFLITGTTTGIGRITAIHLARRGHRVFATGRNQQALAEVAREAAGLPLETVYLDVTDAASIAAAHDEIQRLTKGAGVDVVVNNAGYGKAGPLEEVSDAELRGQYETNVFGLVAVSRAFLPDLRRNGGRLINVSSVGGRMTFPFMGAYNSTKYAVESLSDALRAELAPAGIDVVLIEPGPIRTEFNNTFIKDVERYRRPDSPYETAFQKMDKVLRSFERFSVGPEVIARVIERAATVRRPRARYIAPFTSALSLYFVRAMPTRLADWVMRTFLGLPRRSRALPSSTERELTA
jgi:NAD(P)-dependent dehydrogenase (short-subunit alcohol dehydrogenase family)